MRNLQLEAELAAHSEHRAPPLIWWRTLPAHVFISERTIVEAAVASVVTARLHTTALMEGKVSYSVSRVNERFLEVLLAGWVIVFLTAAAVLAFPSLIELEPCTAAAVQIGLPLIAFSVGAWRIVRGQKSELRGRAFKRDTMDPL